MPDRQTNIPSKAYTRITLECVTLTINHPLSSIMTEKITLPPKHSWTFGMIEKLRYFSVKKG